MLFMIRLPEPSPFIMSIPLLAISPCWTWSSLILYSLSHNLVAQGKPFLTPQVKPVWQLPVSITTSSWPYWGGYNLCLWLLSRGLKSPSCLDILVCPAEEVDPSDLKWVCCLIWSCLQVWFFEPSSCVLLQATCWLHDSSSITIWLLPP